jgi:hypothetical protein
MLPWRCLIQASTWTFAWHFRRIPIGRSTPVRSGRKVRGAGRIDQQFCSLAMTIIETHPGESDADLRAVTDAILQTLNPSKPNWWHPYELRGTYQRDGKLFREFYCIAGSVQIWLWKLAGENQTREVLMVDEGAAGQPSS